MIACFRYTNLGEFAYYFSYINTLLCIRLCKKKAHYSIVQRIILVWSYYVKLCAHKFVFVQCNIAIVTSKTKQQI